MEAPVQVSVAGLVGAVESAAGSSIGSLAVGGVAPGLSANLHALGAALADGAIDLVVDTISQAAADVVGEALEVIPVLGGFAKMLFGLVSAGFQARGLVEEALERCVQQKLEAYCKALPQRHSVKVTSGTSPTPADLFRQCAYAYQFGDDRLPVTVASMYVLLCGAEAEGFGFGSKAVYDQWLRDRSWSSGGTMPHGPLGNYGIDPALQRKMWSLIKGIMAAVQNPALGVRPTATDQGRTLMPLLQEIVRQQWTRDRLPRPYLEALSDFVAVRYTRSCSGSIPGGAGAPIVRRGSCAGPRRISLVPSLESSLSAWETLLEDQWYNANTGRWTITPAGMFVKAMGSRGLLSIDPRSANRIEKAVATATAPWYEQLTPFQGMAIGTGLLGLGYASWTAVRRFGARKSR
jgi:hypothetical protein